MNNSEKNIYTEIGISGMPIMALQAAFEHGNIKTLNNPILSNEWLSYESHRPPRGFAESSDDYVMALAIACVVGR